MDMEIGLWIHTGHFAAGGPTAVIIGILIGIKKLLPNAIILINEPGWFNIQLFGIYQDVRMYPKNTIFGPNPIPLCYIGMNKPTDDLVWSHGNHLIFSAMWVVNWLEQKFPIRKALNDKTKTIDLWESGIDTDYFTPTLEPKTQDFFIYYKSQRMADIENIWSVIFHNFYGMTGTVVCYHFYKPAMLREAARKSKFCIMLDNEETQGLAALEIMACDCPIFCIDRTYYKSNNNVMEGSVTSIVSWSPECGLKSTEEVWKSDFETFLSNLSSYSPAKFVHENYSYREAARKLMNIAFKVRDLEQETEQS